MVRFARAEGSKGSNKRVLEDATPWEEMVAAIHPPPQQQPKQQQQQPPKQENGDTTEKGTKEGNEIKETETQPIKSEVVKGKKTLKKGKKEVQTKTGVKREHEEGDGEETAPKPKKKKKNLKQTNGDNNKGTKDTPKKTDKSNTQNNAGKKKKVQKPKGGDNKDEETVEKKKEFSVNKKGKRVKVFKNGAERTWFDLPYEDGPRMTRYEDLWVKTDVVAKLNALKKALKEEGLADKDVRQRMMKAKRKAHKELRIELIYEQKRCVQEQLGDSQDDAGNEHKDRQEGEEGVKDEGMDVDGASEGVSETKDDDNSENELIIHKNPHKEKVDNTKLNHSNSNNKDLKKNRDQNKSQNKTPGSKKKTDTFNKNQKNNNTIKNGPNKNQKNANNNNKKNNNKQSKLKFEENDHMSMFDGFWVRRVVLPRLQEVRERNRLRITHGEDRELTQHEQIQYQRAMKKEKRFEHAQLIKELKGEESSFLKSFGPWKGGDDFKKDAGGGGGFRRAEGGGFRKQFGSGANTESLGERTFFENVTPSESSSSDEVVKFDGFFVKKEGAERLKKLQARLVSEGTPQDEMDRIMKLERRREEKVLKTERKMSCLKCGEAGHMVNACPMEADQADDPPKDAPQPKNVHKTFTFDENENDNVRSNTEPVERIFSDRFYRDDGGLEESDDVVKFDGFLVKKEAAERLKNLQSRLLSEGAPRHEVERVMKLERRKEERLLRKERTQVCLQCRQPGHQVSACPQQNSADKADICYTCGSTEHTSRTCNIKAKGAQFAYATCFICSESGHIARECPDNPRGLYPKGGACRECGSVEHLRKDCPDLQEEKSKSAMRVGRIDRTNLEALDFDDEAAGDGKIEKRVKVVTF